MELADMLGAVGIGAVLGLALVGLYVWVLWRRLKSRIDQLVKEVIKEAEANMVGLHIEVDKNIYFCYNNDDKTFVCQGTTVEEIKQAFQARYPDKIAYLAGGDPDVVEHFKTELLKLEPNENSISK